MFRADTEIPMSKNKHRPNDSKYSKSMDKIGKYIKKTLNGTIHKHAMDIRLNAEYNGELMTNFP